MTSKDDPKVGSARTANDRPIASTPGSREPNAAEKAAPAAGGAAGALAGGTAGTLIAGPIGTAVGAIAGAVGGWWTGAGVEKSAELAPEDERYYRTHYEASSPADGSWERVRPVYQLGHAAASNPEYRGRSFSDIEADLQHGFKGGASSAHGDWQSVRDLARAAYERRVSASRIEKKGADIGETESHRRPDFADPLPDASRLSGASGHPGVAGGPGDIPRSATRPAEPAGRTDVGPHSTDATGKSPRP
jgi:hypothetical protein